MASCSEGHETGAQDFCDQCGMAVVAPAVETPVVEPVSCPNCAASRPGGALFCESCGYDYTTGALPEQDLRAELGLPPLKSAQESPPEAVGDPSDDGPPDDEPAPVEAGEAVEAVEAAPRPTSRDLAWVAEVWIDPQWHASQESSEPLPPQGPPRIVALKDRALIGRVSNSRNIHPDIDCEHDAGCSRRQAYLTYASGCWYINDLESANGTFVAPATTTLPEAPIASRTRIDPGMRIYVGAWTRIVIREAIAAEIAAAAN